VEPAAVVEEEELRAAVAERPEVARAVAAAHAPAAVARRALEGEILAGTQGAVERAAYPGGRRAAQVAEAPLAGAAAHL
jgi:hypothetical protein